MNHINRKRKALIAANEISEMRSYILDGIPQKVLIEGKRASNPVVIFLHGGPGSPLPFNAGCRGMFPELTDKATMVYWDQLGCGINDYPIDDSFSIERFVVMTTDLIKQIKADFKECPICIFGVSWGSILAAKAAEIVPEWIDRVVIYGQVLRPLLSHKEVFEVLEKSNMPGKHKARLTLLKDRNATYSIEEFIAVLGWIREYTEGYQAKDGGKMKLGSIIWGLLTSPDYSLKDVKAMVLNGYKKNKSLLNELLSIELSETLRKVQVPYMILQGDTDIVTSTKTVAAFVETSGNNNLHFQMVGHSGHMPGAKGMKEIIGTVFEFFGAK